MKVYMLLRITARCKDKVIFHRRLQKQHIYCSRCDMRAAAKKYVQTYAETDTPFKMSLIYDEIDIELPLKDLNLKSWQEEKEQN